MELNEMLYLILVFLEIRKSSLITFRFWQRANKNSNLNDRPRANQKRSRFWLADDSRQFPRSPPKFLALVENNMGFFPLVK